MQFFVALALKMPDIPCSHPFFRVLAASMEINYVFVLLGVAILWRPQENAKDYAYVMELPPMTADDDDDGDGLELAGVVPSAADDEDEDEKN